MCHRPYSADFTVLRAPSTVGWPDFHPNCVSRGEQGNHSIRESYVKNEFRIRKGAWLAALALCTASASQACDIWTDEPLKVWRGVCNLTIDPKAPKVTEAFLAQGRWPYVFKMPDLVIRKYKFRLVGNSLEILADVTNIGLQSSPATNVGVTVTAIDVSNPASRTLSPMLVAVPPLAATATQRISLGTIFVDYSAHDVDVATAGMVDQVTVAQPVRGTVFEADETNNSLIEVCRVFGPNPDTSIQACN
jgi:hypothetical protein